MSVRRTPAALCVLVSVVALTGCTGGPTPASVATLPAASVAAPPAAAASSAVPSTASSTSSEAQAAAADIGKALAGLPASKPTAARAQAELSNTKVTARTVTSPAHRLAGLTIVLDPGHNGGNQNDPARLNAPVPAGGFTKPCNTVGAETNGGYPEHAYNWDVVNRAAKLLRAQGAKVVLTRHSDTGFGPCVNKRAAIGNAAHANAVVAVHADGASSSAYGYHVIAPALAPDHGNRAILAKSWALALAVHRAFHKATGEANATYVSGGLTKRSDLAGLNLSRVPAIFIECANMRNRSDAARLTSAAWRQKAAAGIVAGITAFLHR